MVVVTAIARNNSEHPRTVARRVRRNPPDGNRAVIVEHRALQQTLSDLVRMRFVKGSICL